MQWDVILHTLNLTINSSDATIVLLQHVTLILGKDKRLLHLEY